MAMELDPLADGRDGAFELVAEGDSAASENEGIFTPLSPVSIEADSVKMPDDQLEDPPD